MIPFLKQVAEHYYGRGEVGKACFVFPNRRSLVFFKKYLAAANCRPGAKPMLMPLTYTINDFMACLYDGRQADRVTLLLELYDNYRVINPKAESLDEFVFWGDVLLGDFNDVDKYRVDTRQLFTNVSDYKALQDTFSYLTENQRIALAKFAGHFEKPTAVKEDFLRIWNLLQPLYEAFRSGLAAKGLAYEGMIYRAVAEELMRSDAAEFMRRKFPDTDLFVFTGLNALNECEKTVLRRLKAASLAEFCWDYEGDMIRDSYNRSSIFMSENVKEFPQAFEFERVTERPEVCVINVASAVGQAKLLPGIFREIAQEVSGGDISQVGRLQDGAATDCAVVLPDETLLMPVLNSIPLEIAQINVTMGYPMTSSTFYSFMSQVAAMQLNIRIKGSQQYFYHRFVTPIFANGIFKKVIGPEGTAAVDQIKSRADLYLAPAALSATPYLEKLFTPYTSGRDTVSIKSSRREGVGSDEARAAEEGTRREAVGGLRQTLSPPAPTPLNLANYLLTIADTTARLLRTTGCAEMEFECAKAYIDALKSLTTKNLPITPKTYIHLLNQILSAITVPFKGEPLRGLQIMGPLETRALDFHHLIILSVNEGTFPRRNVANSFIPPELRRGFGLPTYEYQDAVWAYYFYRLLSRTGKVWLITDSRTEALKSGEESRYIKQLQYHFDLPLTRKTVGASLHEALTDTPIAKTPAHIETIKGVQFSASALQSYLSCQVQFYYRYVEKLRPEQEMAENLDNGMIGSVYHAIMQALYLGDEAMTSDIDFEDRQAVSQLKDRKQFIDKAWIDRWLKDEKTIKNKINDLIMKKIHSFEVSGRDLVTADVILKYVMKTLERDKELIETNGNKGFHILGLEKEFHMNIAGFRFHGYVDRLDSFLPDTIRIVDYKTGKVKEEDENITDAKAEAIAEQLFDKSVADKPKIALQLYIYDRFLKQAAEQNPAGPFAGKKFVNCIYSAAKLFTGLPDEVEINQLFCKAVDKHLEQLMEEIVNEEVPFERTENPDTCGYCDFKTICGR